MDIFSFRFSQIFGSLLFLRIKTLIPPISFFNLEKPSLSLSVPNGHHHSSINRFFLLFVLLLLLPLFLNSLSVFSLLIWTITMKFCELNSIMLFQPFRFYFSFIFAILEFRDSQSAFGGYWIFGIGISGCVFRFGFGLFIDESLRRICGGFWFVVDFVDCFVSGARWQSILKTEEQLISLIGSTGYVAVIISKSFFCFNIFHDYMVVLVLIRIWWWLSFYAADSTCVAVLEDVIFHLFLEACCICRCLSFY